MPHILILFAALFLALTPLTEIVAQNPNDEIFWHNKYETALKEAKETGKPLLVSFRCVP